MQPHLSRFDQTKMTIPPRYDLEKGELKTQMHRRKDALQTTEAQERMFLSHSNLGPLAATASQE